MKRLQLITALIFIFFLIFVGEADAVTPPRISAQAAILVETDTGQILYSKNIHKKMHPASTTKLMTALVAVEKANMQEVVTVSETAAGTKVGTDAGLREGDQLYLWDLLKAALISSANDAAVSIGEHVGGTEDFFLYLMNRKARSLGAFNTCFCNTNGYTQKGHYTTAYDLALISRYVLRDPRLATIVDSSEAVICWINRDKKLVLENTNKLLKSYPWVDGIKTGTTRAAGQCLVALGNKDGRSLIAVVLHSYNRFGEALELFSYGFNNYCRIGTIEGQIEAELPVAGGVEKRVSVVSSRTTKAVIACSELPYLEKRLNVSPLVSAPVRAGDFMGTVSFYFKGEKILESPLTAGEQVDKKTIWQHIFRKKIFKEDSII